MTEKYADRSMNPQVKARWVEALRSGEYEQGYEVLRTHDNKFCCLGVLCNIHAQYYGPHQSEVKDSSIYYLGEQCALPEAVKLWAGLSLDYGAIVTIDGERQLLSTQNDDGKTFLQIADAIEQQL